LPLGSATRFTRWFCCCPPDVAIASGASIGRGMDKL
jgi:hypothetical protein